jgi:OOP family OmpA-OmpF porin
MPNSRGWLAALTVLLCAPVASAQQQAQGFNVERFYPSAPGAGWFVMDDLDIHGDVGGAMELTLAYDRNPLLVGSGPSRLAVVSDRAFANFGGSMWYKRWRFYLNFDLPAVVDGNSGVVSGYSFTGPNVDPSTLPDPIGDVRFGADMRVFGDPHGPFRFGLGAQFYYPSGRPQDYDTDGTFHAMFRALFAGSTEHFTYAAHVGTHLRWFDEAQTPGSPKGSELLFGIAAGPVMPIGVSNWALVVGPEIYGATSLRAFFAPGSTALEGLLSARLEGTRDDTIQMRIKLGGGVGNGQFGAPEWRVLVGIEMFNHNHVDAPR